MDDEPKPEPAEILREYGPFEGVASVHGVTFDGERVWFAAGERLHALDPDSGRTVRTLDVACDAGTAFDGRYLYQVARDRIDKLDPSSGEVVASIPAPGTGTSSGLAWAEGSLWVGQYRDRKILQLDPSTGAVRRELRSDRYVTGVSWVDGELWHGVWEGDESELRRVDPNDGRVHARLALPRGTPLSGVESDRADRFYCGGGPTGTLRAVRRPKRQAKR